MKQIKTIIISVASRELFDQEVNEALADGWELKEMWTEYVPVMDGGDILLVARLERNTEPVTIADWIRTLSDEDLAKKAWPALYDANYCEACGHCKEEDGCDLDGRCTEDVSDKAMIAWLGQPKEKLKV